MCHDFKEVNKFHNIKQKKADAAVGGIRRE